MMENQYGQQTAPPPQAAPAPESRQPAPSSETPAWQQPAPTQPMYGSAPLQTDPAPATPAYEPAPQQAAAAPEAPAPSWQQQAPLDPARQQTAAPAPSWQQPAAPASPAPAPSWQQPSAPSWQQTAAPAAAPTGGWPQASQSYQAAPQVQAPAAWPNTQGAQGTKTAKTLKLSSVIALCAIISLLFSLAGSFITYTLVTNRVTYDGPYYVVDEFANPWAGIVDTVLEASCWFYVEARSLGYAWSGSGVVVSPDGYILTNDHVAGTDGISSMKVTMYDGTEYDAEMIATDPAHDVALCKIEASNLTYMKLGNSGTVSVGDNVLCIGNPLGENPDTVSDGIISHQPRPVEFSDGRTMNLLQLTAPASSGNSGGGIVNNRGEVVGLLNAGMGAYVDILTLEVIIGENISFAVPIADAVDLIRNSGSGFEIPEGKTLGMQTVVYDKNTAKSYGYEEAGLYIAKVEPNTGAYFGELLAGDRILTVNGKEVASETDVSKAISKLEIGEYAEVQVERFNHIYIYRIAVMRDYSDFR